MYTRPFSRGPWDDGLSNPPSPRSIDEHPAHIRSRSSATAHSQSPKRLSVFSRSRSNTANSSMSTMDGSVPSEERSGSSMGWRSEKPERNSRSFLARGSRILRRQGSKINVVATLDEEAEIAQMEKPVPEKPLPQRPERPERPDRPEVSRRHRLRSDHRELCVAISMDIEYRINIVQTNG